MAAQFSVKINPRPGRDTITVSIGSEGPRVTLEADEAKALSRAIADAVRKVKRTFNESGGPI